MANSIPGDTLDASGIITLDGVARQVLVGYIDESGITLEQAIDFLQEFKDDYLQNREIYSGELKSQFDILFAKMVTSFDDAIEFDEPKKIMMIKLIAGGMLSSQVRKINPERTVKTLAAQLKRINKEI